MSQFEVKYGNRNKVVVGLDHTDVAKFSSAGMWLVSFGHDGWGHSLLD